MLVNILCALAGAAAGTAGTMYVFNHGWAQRIHDTMIRVEKAIADLKTPQQ